MAWGQGSEIMESRGMLGLVQEPSDEVKRRATAAVERASNDPDEAKELLQMLGLLAPDREWETAVFGCGTKGRRPKETSE